MGKTLRQYAGLGAILKTIKGTFFASVAAGRFIVGQLAAQSRWLQRLHQACKR